MKELSSIALDELVGCQLSLRVTFGLGLMLRQHEVVEDDGTPNAERERLAVKELLLVGRQEVRTERVLPGSRNVGGDPEAGHPGQQRVGHGGEDAPPQIVGLLVREAKRRSLPEGRAGRRADAGPRRQRGGRAGPAPRLDR